MDRGPRGRSPAPQNPGGGTRQREGHERARAPGVTPRPAPPPGALAIDEDDGRYGDGGDAASWALRLSGPLRSFWSWIATARGAGEAILAPGAPSVVGGSVSLARRPPLRVVRARAHVSASGPGLFLDLDEAQRAEGSPTTSTGFGLTELESQPALLDAAEPVVAVAIPVPVSVASPGVTGTRGSSLKLGPWLCCSCVSA